jgi:hypothetical protein
MKTENRANRCDFLMDKKLLVLLCLIESHKEGDASTTVNVYVDWHSHTRDL